MDGGIAAVSDVDEGPEEDSSGDVEGGKVAVRERNGVLFVGPGLTKPVMSSGTFAGVTLSMNCHDGSRRTIELWSEWSGTGILEADNMSFWVQLTSTRAPQLFSGYISKGF